MRQATESCEEAIATRQPGGMVEGTTHIARLASRLLQLSKQEADNSEDPKYISVLGKGATLLLLSPVSLFEFTYMSYMLG
jgi:hypothetical protein